MFLYGLLFQKLRGSTLVHTYPQLNRTTSLWHVSLLYFSLLIFCFAYICLFLGKNLIKHNAHKYISSYVASTIKMEILRMSYDQGESKLMNSARAWDINMGLPRENDRVSLTFLSFVISAPSCRLTWKKPLYRNLTHPPLFWMVIYIRQDNLSSSSYYNQHFIRVFRNTNTNTNISLSIYIYLERDHVFFMK